MSKSRFRLLGVKILPDCHPGIRKILKENDLYLFTSDYKEGKNNYVLARKVTEGCCLDQIYDIEGGNGRKIAITVNAIVGKNGDGKSTLVEIVLRILNNFAVYCGFRNDHEELMPVFGLRAILYVEINNHVIAFASVSDNSIEIYRDGTIIEGITPAEEPNICKQRLNEELGDELFYTLVVNYSLYAYNSRVFERECTETGSWIDPLFHKNDAYQTPIVLNPMRSSGIINVNREDELSKQRLLSLYVLDGMHPEKRKISDDCIAEGYAFKLEEESKLVTKSIKDYFRSNRAKHLPWVTVERLYRKEDPKYPVKEEEAKNICTHFLEFWESYLLWYPAQKHLAKILKEETKYMEYNHNDQSDFAEYLLLMQKWIKDFNVPCSEKICNSLDYYARKDFAMWLSYTQVYRLVVLKTIWEIMQSKMPELFPYTLDDALGKKDIKASLMKYIVYKLISIMETYNRYQENSHIWETSYDLLCNNIETNISLKGLVRDIDSILDTNDYTTLKLHQAINYLRSIGVIKKKNQAAHTHATGAGTVLAGAEVFVHDKYEYKISFEQLHQNATKMEAPFSLYDIMQKMPPPVFDGEIMVKNSSGAIFPMSMLSSGQVQMLNTVGSFVYHLRNLDFEQKGKRIQYKHVNAIFEEVELYFHPEYQRMFLNYLCRQIENTSLNNIESIGICLITHSPFVLSDILNKNILYLKDGKDESKNIEVNPFASNINDILHQSFFLENGFMGELAVKKILSLGRFLKGYNEDGWNATMAKGVIDCIQEPYIKKQLLTLWDKYCIQNEHSENLISELERQVADLTNRIKKIKDEKNIH